MFQRDLHDDVPPRKRIGALNPVRYRYRRASRGSFLAAASEANCSIFAFHQQTLAERAVVCASVPHPSSWR